ncbi:lysophospholipid acyltransferase family protein [Endothiovibrio diazotrophicus]
MRGGRRLRERLLLGLLRLLAALPLALNHALGAAIGRMMLILPTRMGGVARTNIERCLPELAPAERRRLLRRAMAESGKTFSELGPMWHWSAERLMALAVQVENREAVEEAMAEGRGVVMLTPHLGSWEIGGLYCARHWPMTTLYRPPRMAALEPLIRDGRARTGTRLAKTDAAGVRALMQGLKRGEMVGILPDQEPGEGNGVFAPFFGIPAYTMVLVNRLARRNGAALFIGYAERLPRGRGYRLHFIRCPDDLADEDPEAGAAALNREVERMVRRLPEQYQWGYRRFKQRPEGSRRV